MMGFMDNNPVVGVAIAVAQVSVLPLGVLRHFNRIVHKLIVSEIAATMGLPVREYLCCLGYNHLPAAQTAGGQSLFGEALFLGMKHSSIWGCNESCLMKVQLECRPVI